jgi:hypothetical protein
LKAQISFEFLIVLFFLFIFFLISVAIYVDENKTFMSIQSTLRAKEFAFKISRVVNKVYGAGSGSSFTMLYEPDFNLTIRGRLVEVYLDGTNAQAPLVTDKITIASITRGKFVKVSNENGTIVMNDV